MKEMYNSWCGKMKPTRLIKVNTIVRGRGKEILRCRIKYGDNNVYSLEDWIIVKEGNRYVAKNLTKHIPYAEIKGDIRDIYKILDREIRWAKHDLYEHDREPDLDEFECMDLEDQFNYLMNL